MQNAAANSTENNDTNAVDATVDVTPAQAAAATVSTQENSAAAYVTIEKSTVADAVSVEKAAEEHSSSGISVEETSDEAASSMNKTEATNDQNDKEISDNECREVSSSGSNQPPNETNEAEIACCSSAPTSKDDAPSTSTAVFQNSKPATAAEEMKENEAPKNKLKTRFHSIFDETNEIPDFKIRSEVLKGLKLVFSGLVHTRGIFYWQKPGSRCSAQHGTRLHTFGCSYFEHF